MNPEILAFAREDFEEETQFVKKPPSEYDTVKGEQLLLTYYIGPFTLIRPVGDTVIW